MMTGVMRMIRQTCDDAARLRPRLGLGRLALAAAAVAVLLLAGCGEGEADGAGVTHDQLAAQVGPAVLDTAHAAHGAHAAQADHTAHAHHDTAATTLPAGELPGTSLYHLRSAWTDQAGGSFVLDELRGRPAVFVMFYGDCTTACPLLVRSAELIEQALPDGLRGEVEFVMVTFDTTRDSPERLRAYAESKGLDREGWRWLVGSELQTRQLAALLGVQYRDAGNGMFAHSNVVTVLDPDGVPAARLEGLGVELEPAIAALGHGA